MFSELCLSNAREEGNKPRQIVYKSRILQQAISCSKSEENGLVIDLSV